MFTVLYMSHDNGQLYPEEQLDKYEGWEQNFTAYRVVVPVVLKLEYLCATDGSIVEALLSAGQAVEVPHASNS